MPRPIPPISEPLVIGGVGGSGDAPETGSGLSPSRMARHSRRLQLFRPYSANAACVTERGWVAPAPSIRTSAAGRSRRARVLTTEIVLSANRCTGGRPYGAARATSCASPPSPPYTASSHCQPLDDATGVPAVPAQRKARREQENRVSTLTP
ncbi:hypothetical protein GCM10023336_40260 [Streptomyces similanensis]|uniref:Uncharacterized protein n=1 Tax=Streptomyces similanensis TaxID=1274988 RepID=A0ABP9KN34_9ACTN